MRPTAVSRCSWSLSKCSLLPSARVAQVQTRAQPAAATLTQTGRTHTGPLVCRPEKLYEHALELARLEEYEDARAAFESLLTRQPQLCKAWVSYAQMEKRSHRSSHHADRWQRCRAVLQRGLSLNPTSSCLVQAWGLMELQRGNWLAAVRLLERSARLDVSCSPVLRWQVVQTARKTVGSRRSGQGSGSNSQQSPCSELAE